MTLFMNGMGGSTRLFFDFIHKIWFTCRTTQILCTVLNFILKLLYQSNTIYAPWLVWKQKSLLRQSLVKTSYKTKSVLYFIMLWWNLSKANQLGQWPFLKNFNSWNPNCFTFWTTHRLCVMPNESICANRW